MDFDVHKSLLFLDERMKLRSSTIYTYMDTFVRCIFV